VPFRAVCTIYFGHKISIQHFGIFWDRLGNGAEIVSRQTDGLMRTKGNGAPGCCLWVLLENAIRGSTRMVCVYVCFFFWVLTRYALDRLCRSRPWATNRTKAKVLLAVFLFVAAGFGISCLDCESWSIIPSWSFGRPFPILFVSELQLLQWKGFSTPGKLNILTSSVI
jgi:hypothetical protein